MRLTLHQLPGCCGFRTCRIAVLTTFLVCVAHAAPSNAADSPRVRVPDGFKVTLFADDDLAHDIYSMTIDSLGRVVVSGVGYVKILIDSDADGRADTVKQFVDGPATGAQGMFFHGRDLVCSGGDGLQIYRDDNRDDRADGPPEVFLRIATGAEHSAHSIQHGPDGWWYVIAGNESGVSAAYATLPTSPIRRPHAGVLLRLKSELSGGEIFADGFRNAYDFAFNRRGDLFTFDSDGERDVSLPWYRPTRVFQVRPMSNVGWVSRSWKRPATFFDMPPVVGAFGRGSPTGVVCYRHDAFPERFRDVVLVCDWTFGRVIGLQLRMDGSRWTCEPFDFMTAIGQFGFAPTDIEVGPDGSLYVSIGGRGTRGGVFRITWTGSPAAPSDDENTTELESILAAKQPLSSWSRAKWVPLAEAFGRDAFDAAALDSDLSELQRIRAIEIATELFGGPSDRTISRLHEAQPETVRARAAWSIGRRQPTAPNTRLLRRFMDDDHPFVVRTALEALASAGAETDFGEILPQLARNLGAPHRPVRQTASRILGKLNGQQRTDVLHRLAADDADARLAYHFGILQRSGQFDRAALEAGLSILAISLDVQTRVDAARLMQVALGDVGPLRDRPPVLDGYASPIDLSSHERILDPVRARLSELFPFGTPDVDREVARIIAMLAPSNSGVLDGLFARISEHSHPVDDLHYLLVISRIEVARTFKQTRATAEALVTLERKIVLRKLHQGGNWDDRVGELYRRLVEVDPALPATLIDQREFGRPGHMVFLGDLPSELLSRARDAVARRIENDDEYTWTSDVVFVLGESAAAGHRALIRTQLDNRSVRDAIVTVLAKRPESRDRTVFVDALNAPDVEVLSAAAEALTRLPIGTEAAEHFALLSTSRRLGENTREFEIRERLIRVLQHNSGKQFGFEFGEGGHRSQADVLRKWSQWLAQRFPEEARSRDAGGSGIEEIRKLATTVDWDVGNPIRGAKVFEKRSCTRCHGARRALGPDLKGVAGRFSRDDLLTAIIQPDRDVSPRYQTTVVETTAGRTRTGLIVYESVDGLLMRNGTGQTFRIEADEIQSRRKLPLSLMPSGLLKDCTAKELADLYAYIRTLGRNDADQNQPPGQTQP